MSMIQFGEPLQRTWLDGGGGKLKPPVRCGGQSGFGEIAENLDGDFARPVVLLREFICIGRAIWVA